MRAVRPLLACLAVAAAFAGSAATAGSLANVEVYDRTAGRTLPIYEYDGRLYVAGEPRHQYELRVRNSSNMCRTRRSRCLRSRGPSPGRSSRCP